MTEPKKRITTKQRLARAAYYIQNRTVTCEHCEDYPHLVEAHDRLALKNRHLKKRCKELEGEVQKLSDSLCLLEHQMNGG